MEDSRLKGYFGTVTQANQPYERTYCVNCGKPRGWVTKESYAFIKTNQIIVLCDNCESVFGAPNGAIKLDIKEA